jgi:hypothetical protein
VRQQGLLTYGFMAATIAVLTFVYADTVLLTHFLAERMRANPDDRRGCWRNWPVVPDRLWHQAGGLALSGGLFHVKHRTFHPVLTFPP